MAGKYYSAEENAKQLPTSGARGRYRDAAGFVEVGSGPEAHAKADIVFAGADIEDCFRLEITSAISSVFVLTRRMCNTTFNT
jgi:hypothetical protein